MIYNSNATKQTKAVYEQNSVHKMEKEITVGTVKSVTQKKPVTCNQEDVKVILEYLKEVDPKAEEEFRCRLKEIYLRKIKFGSMQVGKSAVQSTPPEKGEVSNQEDKDYE